MKIAEREQVEKSINIRRKKGLVESTKDKTIYYCKAVKNKKTYYLMFFTYENQQVIYRFLFKTDLFNCEKYDYAAKKSGKSLILRTIGLHYAYWYHKTITYQFYDKSTEKVLSPFKDIEGLENTISLNREIAKEKKVKNEIKELMKPIKTPSKAFLAFCDNRASHRLFFDKNEVICTKCNNTFQRPADLKNHKLYKCPYCNTISKTVPKNNPVKTNYSTTLKLECLNRDLLVVRFFRTSSNFKFNSASVETKEFLRGIMHFTEDGKGKVDYYQRYYNGEWYRCVAKMGNPSGISGLNTLDNLYIYKKYNALSELNKCNKLVFGLPELLNKCDHIASDDDIWGYICCNYKSNNILELFTKAGLYKLAYSGMHSYYYYGGHLPKLDHNGKSLAKKLMINKWYLNMAQQYDLGSDCIKTMQQATSAGYSNKSYEAISILTKMECDIDIDTAFFRFSDKTLSKILNYIQGINKSDYKDYVNACVKLKYRLNDFILFPKNFEQSHDETIAMLKAEENKILEKEYNDLNKKISKKYLYETDGVIFRTPLNVQEFAQEGNSLQICVFRMAYHKKMINNKCVIVFARQKENPDKSWVCIELSPENRVVQARGFGNSTPTKDFYTAFDKYKKHLKAV